MKTYLPILSAIEQAIQNGLREVAEEVLAESNKLAPIDEGTLRKSGHVDVEDLQANISYETPNRAKSKKRYPYILRQHEDMKLRHATGQAKFLESAADASRARALQTMARRAGELG